MKFFFLLVLLLGLSSDAQAEINQQKIFEEIIVKANWRLNHIAEQRPFRLKEMNNAVDSLAFATRAMLRGTDRGEIWQALESANKSYSPNPMALLLQAILKDTGGSSGEANQLFEEFLLNSTVYSKLEESFLKWAEFHTLRRVVYELLSERGISFEGKEEELHVRVPYYEFIQYLMSPQREDFILNIVFVVFILGGGVALALGGMMGVDYSRSLPGTLMMVYLILWVAYLIWIADLALGLPYGLNRMQVVPIFLGGSLGVIGLLELVSYISEKRRPLEEGYRKCPHCGALIVELAIECKHCRKSVES